MKQSFLASTMLMLSFCLTAKTSWADGSPTTGELPQCDIPETSYQYNTQEHFGRWIFNATVEAQLGGKTFAKVPTGNGSVRTMHAGDGTLLGLGLLYRSFTIDKDIGFKLGYLFDKTSVKNTELDNGYLEFTRHVADVYVHHRDKRHRYGGGLTYHFNNQFTSRTDKVEHIVVENTLGVFAEYLYDFPSSKSLLGFKYFYIDYHSNDDKANASGLGVVYRYYF